MELNSSSSLLLRLPREVRDMILSYVLIPGTIALEPAVTKAPRSRIAVGGEVGFCEALYHQYKLTYPLTSRGTWTIPLRHLAVPEAEFQLDSETVYMTYQFASSTHGRQSKDIGTHLLQVCKQLYVEGAKLFYGKNTFIFANDYRIPTAATFLQDRPTASLRLIKSLELHLIETEKPSFYPPGDRYAALHILQCGYGHYEELCNVLSSPGMDLRTLSLTIEPSHNSFMSDVGSISTPLEADVVDWSIPENRDQQYSLQGSDWVYPWLSVKTLDRLSIFWINGPKTRSVGRTMVLMGEHMLGRKTRPTTNESTSASRRIEILYRAVKTHSNTLLPREQPSGSAAVYDQVEQSVSNRSCVVNDDGRKLIEVDEGDYHLNSEPERPLVQKYLEAANFCLTCYCELNAA